MKSSMYPDTQETSGNIYKLYTYYFLSRLNLWAPVFILYLLDRGFSMTQITSLDAIFWLIMVLFEIPTGAVADKWGKKQSLILSCLLIAVGLFIFGLAKTYVIVLIAYLLWAVGVTFESGALAAFLYDSLRVMGREVEYSKFAGRGMSISLMAASVGSVTAGYLGGIFLGLPILASSGIAVLMLIITLTFTEPRVEKTESESYLLHVKESFSFSWKHPQLRTLLFFYAFTYAAFWVAGIFYQPYLKNLGINVEMIGVLYLGFTLLGAAGASMASRYESFAGESGFFLSMPLVFLVSLLFMGMFNASFVISFLFVNSFFKGTFWPVMGKHLNVRIPSEKRATILSLANLLWSFVMIPSEPIFGYLADRFSLNTSILILAAVYLLIISGILAYWFIKCKKMDSATVN